MGCLSGPSSLQVGYPYPRSLPLSLFLSLSSSRIQPTLSHSPSPIPEPNLPNHSSSSPSPFFPRSHNYCQVFTKAKSPCTVSIIFFSLLHPERHESCGNVLTRLSKQQPLVDPRHKGLQRQPIGATWLHQSVPGGDFTGEAPEGLAIRTLENCTSSHEKGLLRLLP